MGIHLGGTSLTPYMSIVKMPKNNGQNADLSINNYNQSQFKDTVTINNTEVAPNPAQNAFNPINNNPQGLIKDLVV